MGALSRFLLIALGPAAVAGVLVSVPRVLRALSARAAAGDAELVGPPLERTAADLRRLLAEHRAVHRSPRLPVRATRLAALEGAITDCALDLARAVGVPAPTRSGRAALPRDELRSLLGALVASGVVLPPAERFGRA